jgi:tRNA threonylcarbamoyladenosine modification (KEOPS) complex  Pcc1 subunit
VATKKSDWTAEIRLTSPSSKSLAASLSCEDALVSLNEEDIQIHIEGSSASDLRARFNSTMRSLRAASEALMSIGDGGEFDA